MPLAFIEKHPAPVVVAAGAMLILLAVISAIGGRPYGQESIDQQIALDDADLCSKLGFAPNGAKFEDCMRALAGLRTQHESLLIAYAWP